MPYIPYSSDIKPLPNVNQDVIMSYEKKNYLYPIKKQVVLVSYVTAIGCSESGFR